ADVDHRVLRGEVDVGGEEVAGAAAQGVLAGAERVAPALRAVGQDDHQRGLGVAIDQGGGGGRGGGDGGDAAPGLIEAGAALAAEDEALGDLGAAGGADPARRYRRGYGHGERRHGGVSRALRGGLDLAEIAAAAEAVLIVALILLATGRAVDHRE